MTSLDSYRIGAWRDYLEAAEDSLGNRVLDIAPLDSARTALVLVDIQRKMVDDSGAAMFPAGRSGRKAGWDGDVRSARWQRIRDVVMPNVGRLLGEFRRRGLHILHFAAGPQLPKGEDLPMSYRQLLMPGIKAFGSTVHWNDPRYDFPEELQPLDNEFVIRKRTRSGFIHTEAEGLLRALGITDLVVVGGATEACVESTARDAADCGFKVVVVEDAVIPATPLSQDCTMIAISLFFGAVRTTAEVLAELGSANVPQAAAAVTA
jgi:biuret amidohydrolase